MHCPSTFTHNTYRAEWSAGGAFVEVQAPIARLTLDIIVRTAFDCDFSAQRGDPAALDYLANLNELAHESFASLAKYDMHMHDTLW